MLWDSMQSWNAQIPEGWAGKDGLLYDRPEESSSVYHQPEMKDVWMDDRVQPLTCGCGCGGLTLKGKNGQYRSFIPGHKNTRKHFRNAF